VAGVAAGRVSPFGHPGITAHVQLPQAYRSLSRPSSPLDAKASTVCLIAFDLKSHVVPDPAIGSGRPVLIPHTLPDDIRALASEHPGASRQTIHSSIVKEHGGPHRARQADPKGTRQKKVMRARKRRSAGDF
jgi:hypothetical protein